MDNIVVCDITKRLNALETELDTLEEQLAEVQAERDVLATKVENYRGVLADYSQWEGATVGRRVRSEDLHDIMIKILEEARVPLHYKTIYQKLLNDGIHVAGEDPVKNTGAHLSSDAQFVSVGQGEWALAKWGSKAGVENSAPADEIDDLPF